MIIKKRTPNAFGNNNKKKENRRIDLKIMPQNTFRSIKYFYKLIE